MKYDTPIGGLNHDYVSNDLMSNLLLFSIDTDDLVVIQNIKNFINTYDTPILLQKPILIFWSTDYTTDNTNLIITSDSQYDDDIVYEHGRELINIVCKKFGVKVIDKSITENDILLSCECDI